MKPGVRDGLAASCVTLESNHRNTEPSTKSKLVLERETSFSSLRGERRGQPLRHTDLYRVESEKIIDTGGSLKKFPPLEKTKNKNVCW